MKSQKLKAVAFDDPNGASIKVPADQLALYSTIKSDQLAVLNRILADHAAGFKVDFDENTICSLTGLAGELAHACNQFMCAFSGALYVPPAEREVAREVA